MALKSTSLSLCSVPALFFSFTLICTLSLSLFFLSNPSSSPSSSSSPIPQHSSIKVYVPDLPRSLNYGLLDKYWASGPDSRLPSDADPEIPRTHLPKNLPFPPYPENPLIKQYSAEYWIDQIHKNFCSNILVWKKPAEGLMKLNIDGSRLGQNGKIATGGVIRNSSGHWMCGFQANLGVGEVLDAETWGLFHGLKLAVDCNITNLVVESDSPILVNLS